MITLLLISSIEGIVMEEPTVVFDERQFSGTGLRKRLCGGGNTMPRCSISVKQMVSSRHVNGLL
jgi:hypothetical protein